MANWTGPFHLPKFTAKEFEEKKRQYNEKYGYTITVPALGDIIHLRPFKPLTEEETALWKARKYEEIPKNRLKDIRNEKARKKAKFLAMMGSPTPKIPRAAGAILTAFDDLQDAVSTLACIGLMTAAVVGGTTAALLAGPLGWVVGASAALNLINPFSRLKGPKGRPYSGRLGKKNWEKWQEKNPFTKKARARVAKNITKFKPSIGNAVEALQVTDNIFGFGLCLGPVMGFAMDVISAKVRGSLMQKVDIKMSPMWKTDAVEIATRALKSCSLVNGYVWESDFMDEVYSYIGANLAMQVMAPYIEEYNPIAEVEDLATYKIEAPRPRDILTLEIIQEAGYTVDEVCNWPQNGKRWISYDELSEKTAPVATENLRHFAEKHKNSALALIAGQNAHDFALHSLAAWEGEDQVEIEYLSSSRIIIMIMDNGWCYPDDIRMDQVRKFEDWCYVHEYMGTVPSAKEIWRYADIFCDFRWADTEDEYR